MSKGDAKDRAGRQVRPIVERLRAAGVDGDVIHCWNLCVEAAGEIERLTKALLYAKHGFARAYQSAEKRLNDEVLLHCGHHEAAAHKALRPNKDKKCRT